MKNPEIRKAVKRRTAKARRNIRAYWAQKAREYKRAIKELFIDNKELEEEIDKTWTSYICDDIDLTTAENDISWSNRFISMNNEQIDSYDRLLTDALLRVLTTYTDQRGGVFK